MTVPLIKASSPTHNPFTSRTGSGLKGLFITKQTEEVTRGTNQPEQPRAPRFQFCSSSGCGPNLTYKSPELPKGPAVSCVLSVQTAWVFTDQRTAGHTSRLTVTPWDQHVPQSLLKGRLNHSPSVDCYTVYHREKRKESQVSH